MDASKKIANPFSVLLGQYATSLCAHPEAGTITSSGENPFFLPHSPPIPLPAFVQRLERYFACSAEAYVVAAVYLQRLAIVRPGLFHARSVHKIVLAALTIATKFTDDVVCKQLHYALCGGIEVPELNNLEDFFLRQLQFTVFVSEAEFTSMEEFVQTPMHKEPVPMLGRQPIVRASFG